MAVKNFEISWSEGAQFLLRKRDHYTRDAIQCEFAEDPEKEVVSVDSGNWFATPVANHRYSVIWKRMPDQRQAVVEAVVPAQFAPNKAGTLMQQVMKVVEQESNGDVKLTDGAVAGG